MRAAIVVWWVLAALLAASWAAPAATGDTSAQPTGGTGQDARPRAVLPADGPVVRLFDPPEQPYGRGHRGVDIAAPAGGVVRAALPGVVTFAGEVARRGWVTVDHGAGLETTYGVLDPRAVAAGQRVDAGQPLGRLAPGAGHVDWGARLHGAYIDPLRLFARWRPHLTRLPR